MDTEHLPSPTFLKLPLEIRVKVYHSCFAGRTLPCVPTTSAAGHVPPRWSLVDNQDWPLLLTCKQIHAEALPEYYRVSEFWCCRTAGALGKASTIPIFRENVRNLTFEPFKAFPDAGDLLALPDLAIVRMVNLRAFEPLGINTRGNPQYDPLSHATMLLAAQQANQIHWPNPEPGSQMRELEANLLKAYTKSSKQRISRPQFLLNYNYSYAEKVDHPDGWGGMTPKHMKSIEYNQTDDVFTFMTSKEGRLQYATVQSEA